MAEVFRRANGMKLTKVIALHIDVQRELDLQAEKYGVRAEAILDARAQHRTGTSRIAVESGDVDRYVILDDTRGLRAAMTIEYGRQAHGAPDEEAPEAGAMVGLFPLHDAFGLPH